MHCVPLDSKLKIKLFLHISASEKKKIVLE